MLPRGRDAGDGVNIDAQVPTIFVTVHPDTLAKGALRSLGTVLIIGRDSLGLIEVLSRTLGQPYSRLPERGPEVGEAIYWECRGDAPPVGSSPSTSRRVRRSGARANMPTARCARTVASSAAQESAECMGAELVHVPPGRRRRRSRHLPVPPPQQRTFYAAERFKGARQASDQRSALADTGARKLGIESCRPLPSIRRASIITTLPRITRQPRTIIAKQLIIMRQASTTKPRRTRAPLRIIAHRRIATRQPLTSIPTNNLRSEGVLSHVAFPQQINRVYIVENCFSASRIVQNDREGRLRPECWTSSAIQIRTQLDRRQAGDRLSRSVQSS